MNQIVKRKFYSVVSDVEDPKDCATKLDHLMYALQQEGQHRYGYDFETISLLFQAGFKKNTYAITIEAI